MRPLIAHQRYSLSYSPMVLCYLTPHHSTMRQAVKATTEFQCLSTSSESWASTSTVWTVDHLSRMYAADAKERHYTALSTGSDTTRPNGYWSMVPTLIKAAAFTGCQQEHGLTASLMTTNLWFCFGSIERTLSPSHTSEE